MHKLMNDGEAVPARPQRRRRGGDREETDDHEVLIMGETSPTRGRDREPCRNGLPNFFPHIGAGWPGLAGVARPGNGGCRKLVWIAVVSKPN